MFTPKSLEYLKERDEIIEQMRNLCGEKSETSEMKKLNKRLYDLFKQEDLKSSNKPIYSLRLDTEDQSKKRRVFSKIFKLYENNQYGFAIRKPLPIGTFKKKPRASMEILTKSLRNFDPNIEVREISVVDIEFAAYDDPKKRCTMRFSCVFLNRKVRYL